MDQDATRRRRRRGPSALSVTNGSAEEGSTQNGGDKRKVHRTRSKKDPGLCVFMVVSALAIAFMMFLGYTCYQWMSQSADNRNTYVDVHVVQHEEHKVKTPRKRRAAVVKKPLKRSLCNEKALSEFLHEEPVDGMHVICAEIGTSVGRLDLSVFPGAQLGNPEETMAEFSWHGVRDALKDALKLRTADDLHPPWAIFTPVGERIVGEDDPFEEDSEDSLTVAMNILEHGMVLLFEGGQWVWPGVKVGFQRYVDLYSIMPGDPPKSIVSKEERTVALETLSLRPLVLSVEGFLSDDECEYVQQQAAPNIKYSGVVLMDKDKGKPASDFRTSQSTFLHNHDETTRDIDYRTASLVRIPRSHQEQVQVLRYGVTEKYNAHHDFFDPALYQKDPATLRTIQNGRRNRMATVFWYLSDVEEGGHTLFPRWNGAPQPRKLDDCSYGLKVKPERGKVIIFYSMTAAGKTDPLSLHAACPVQKGVKWAANKWVWNLPMNYIRDK